MKYAVLVVPGFALHALRRSDPGLCGRAVALVGGEGRNARVAEASPEAQGVVPGLAATLAMSRCPGVILRQRDPAAEVEAHRLLLAAAFTIAPRVESTRGGCCTIDLQGADPARTEALMRLATAELAAAGLPARIGAGATPLLASYAARRAEPVLVVRDPAGFLAPLPLAFAEPAPGQAAILQGWGIGTLGELTALPKAEVGRRLGTEGVLLWERAAGEAIRRPAPGGAGEKLRRRMVLRAPGRVDRTPVLQAAPVCRADCAGAAGGRLCRRAAFPHPSPRG